jgi:hypothetical protein
MAKIRFANLFQNRLSVRFIRRCRVCSEIPDSKRAKPRRGRGLHPDWSRKEELPVFLLLLLVSLTLRLRRFCVKIDFWFLIADLWRLAIRVASLHNVTLT